MNNELKFNITKERFYDDNINREEYKNAQIKRHKAKVRYRRDKNHYISCSKEIISEIKDGSQMICLGTRNNYERDVWKNSLSEKKVNVYSLDISPLSRADYIMDFSSFPESWNNKWDIVFSNSLDHSPDPDKTLIDWFSIVKNGGLLIIGFEDRKGFCVDANDCSDFDIEQLEKVFFNNNQNYICIKKIEISYTYYVLRKNVNMSGLSNPL